MSDRVDNVAVCGRNEPTSDRHAITFTIAPGYDFEDVLDVFALVERHPATSLVTLGDVDPLPGEVPNA